MKKLFLAIATVAVAVLSGCDKTPKVVNATVVVSEADLEAGVPKPDSYTVSLTNTTTAEVVKADTENGSASFVLAPGLYNVLVEGASNADGVAYTISASDSFSALEEGASVTVKVKASKSAALIFKEVFYCGHEDWYFRDQYYEIYNNSDQTVYADGLCICNLELFDYEGTPIEYDIENAQNYVFGSHVWQVPGNGTTYPVAPGESIVIAQWATDHSQEGLGGALGKDLISAEFEAIVGESTLWNGTVITDNPAVNMVKFAENYSLPQWLTPVGGASLILFFPPKGMDGTALTYTVGSDSIYGAALAIPIDCVLDGIHTCESDAKAIDTAIPSAIDAGFVCCSGTYVNESIVRKVAETKADGRKVYKDTNNSTADFEVSTDPKIRRNGEGTPSWNTWK